MSQEPARTGIGDIPIQIKNSNGQLEDFKLVPTLEACQTLSRLSGGLVELSRKIVALDFDSIVTVVSFGLGYGGTRRPPKDWEQRLYSTGLNKLAAPCVQFINNIANGGQPLVLTEAEEGEANQDSSNPPKAG